MFSRILFLTSLFLVPVATLWSQQETFGHNFRFHNYSIDQGLSQVSIICSIQDSQGFLWFGTQDGLNRYDGYQFKTFTHNSQDPNSLSDNFIWDLLEDEDGIIWIATRNRGLNRYDPKQDQFTTLKAMEANPNYQNVSVIFGEGDLLWLGLNGGGLLSYNKSTEALKSYQIPNSNHNHVSQIFKDKQGILWIGTFGDGLFRFEPKNGKFYSMGNSERGGLSNSWITGILEDHQGNLWVSTLNGLNRLTPDRGFIQYYADDSPENLSHSRILALFLDNKGNLWIGTKNGLNKYNHKQDSFQSFFNRPDDPHSISHNDIRSILQDRTGVLWFGTWGGGVNKFDPASLAFETLRNKTQNNNAIAGDNIRCIYQSKQGQLWFGDWNSGLNHYDQSSKTFSLFKHDPDNPNSLSNNQVNYITEDSKGNLWIATYGGGLNKKTEHGFQHYRISDGLSSDRLNIIMEDDSGKLWIGTRSGGLNCLDPETEKFLHFRKSKIGRNGLSSDTVRALAMDAESIWVGTWSGGVNRLDRNTHQIEVFTPEPNATHGFTHNRITCMLMVDQKLWVGTFGGGLHYLDLSKKPYAFEAFTTQHGFATDSIASLAMDQEGTIWMGTGRGISSFNPKSLSVKNFSQLDGTQEKGYFVNSSTNDRLGNLYFGGFQGITIFHPSNIQGNIVAPKVQFTHFKVFNEDVPIGEFKHNDWESTVLENVINHTETLTLPYQAKVFSLEFSALHFANPSKNTYAYRMVNFDDHWIQSNHKHAVTYTNLNPGAYQFQVKAANGNQVWQETPTTLHIIVKAPPWKTPLAYSLYTIIALSILVLAFWAQQRRIRNKQKTIKKLRKLDQLKDQFLANTSHELRTPINGINGIVESLLDGVSGPLSDDVKKSLQLVLKSGQRLANSVTQILDFTKLKKGVTLQRETITPKELVTKALTAYSNKKNHLTINHQIPEQLPALFIDSKCFTQALHHLLDNAIKFSNEGVITVSASADDTYITIAVKDCGIGMSQEEQDWIFEPFGQGDGSNSREYGGHGLGLSIVQQILLAHHGKIIIESQKDQGTTVNMCFPAQPIELTEQQTPVIPKPIPKQLNFDAEDERESEPLAVPEKEVCIPAKATPTDKEPSKILVVDDEPINLQVLRNHLGLAGYEVVTVNCGVRALEELEKWTPDLVLLDVMMPKMSGYEVCVEARKRFSAIELPIIILTAKTTNKDLVDSFEAGASDFITKPIVKQVLLSRIATQLKLLQLNRDLKISQEKALLHAQAEARAKFATSVLHNIGNVLNSVNIIASRATNQMGNARFEQLAQVSELLEKNREQLGPYLTEDPRGKLIPEYLKRLGTMLGEDQNQLRDEIMDMRDNITTMKDIISRQQQDAKHKRNIQPYNLADLCREALRINRVRLEDAQVQSKLDLSDEIYVSVFRIEFLEILMNLIKNAVEAMSETPIPERQLNIYTQDEDDGIHLFVEDTGIGFNEDNLKRAFSEEFTTKETGHGFGLAFCGTSIKNMGGSIQVHSPGQNQGSCFEITLEKASMP